LTSSFNDIAFILGTTLLDLVGLKLQQG